MHLLSLCPCLGPSQVRVEKKRWLAPPLAATAPLMGEEVSFTWDFGPATPAITTETLSHTRRKNLQAPPEPLSALYYPLPDCGLPDPWLGNTRGKNSITSSVELPVLVFSSSVHLLLLIFFFKSSNSCSLPTVQGVVAFSGTVLTRVSQNWNSFPHLIQRFWLCWAVTQAAELMHYCKLLKRK